MSASSRFGAVAALVVGLASSTLAGLVVCPAQAQPLAPGHLVVTQATDLMAVDPSTGDRRILTGWRQRQFGGAAASDDGFLYLLDILRFVDEVVRFDPLSGTVESVTSFSLGSGPDLRGAAAIAVEADGRLLVADTQLEAIVRVDPVSHERVVVSGGDVGAGPAMSPTGIAIEGSGTWLVVDAASFAVMRVDSSTGDRATLSGPGVGSGPSLEGVSTIALDGEGWVYVTGYSMDAVARIDPVSGDREIVSSDTIGAGPPLRDATALAFAENGDLVVASDDVPSVLRIDLETGDRMVVSGGDIGSGDPIEAARGLVSWGDEVWVTGRDLVVAVDLETGARTWVSQQRAGAGPGLIFSPYGSYRGLAVGPRGEVYTLIDDTICTPSSGCIGASNRALLRVDATTGDRTIVTGRVSNPSTTAGSGPGLGIPADCAVEPGGAVVVSSTARGGLFSQPVGRLHRVDPATGSREILADPEVGEGPSFEPGPLTVDREGDALVGASTPPHGAVVMRVAGGSGDRTIVSGGDIGSRDDLLVSDIAEAHSGALIVSQSSFARVLRIDPSTGDRELLSGTGRGEGPPFGRPSGVAVSPEGKLFVADSELAAIFSVDPITGDREIVSSPDVGTGPRLGRSAWMEVYRVPEPHVALAAMASLVVVARLRRARQGVRPGLDSASRLRKNPGGQSLGRFRGRYR